MDSDVINVVVAIVVIFGLVRWWSKPGMLWPKEASGLYSSSALLIMFPGFSVPIFLAWPRMLVDLRLYQALVQPVPISVRHWGSDHGM